MDVSVVITREGNVSVYAQTGTFGEAREKIGRLLTDLGLEGIQFELIGDVERHAHDRPDVHQQLGQRIGEGGSR